MTGDITIPDDAPEPPAGFDEPRFIGETEPTRYDCLLCETTHLTGEELRSHVKDTHDCRELYMKLRGVNFPLVAWYIDDGIPFTAYTHQAARYARKVLEIDGNTPEPVKRMSEGQDPVTGEPISSTHPRSMARGLSHDVWPLYEILREHVPEEYERSPVYDNGGYPEPAATVNRLQPGDVVAWQADGWSQSLGTPRGQTRDTVRSDDDWEAKGVVTNVKDSRTDELLEREWIDRTVWVVSKTDLNNEKAEVSLEPRSDGDVVVKLEARVKQRRASQQKGHGGPGYTKAELEHADEIERVPWHERDSFSTHR